MEGARKTKAGSRGYKGFVPAKGLGVSPTIQPPPKTGGLKVSFEASSEPRTHLVSKLKREAASIFCQ